MKWHAFVERIAPLGTRRRNWYDLGIIGLQTIANEGFKSFWRKYKLYKNSKKFSKKVRKAEDIKIELPEDLPELDVKVSVIIPTKNAGKDFDFTLEKIRNQKGLRELEIIVVDSGSQEETTEIALKHGAKIVSIRPEDFSHSKARNLGAKKAKGEYLVFMTQDAIPVGEYLFYTMIKVMGSENNIAAVTCRQIPRSDADSFACFILWNHYRALELDKDKILYGGKDFEKLPYLEKRKRCQLDSVCFMIKKDVFEKFRFNEDLDYAEDLELGLRLIKNGYKIAFLASSAVIHSHNRPPIYFLKRAFVDTTTLQKIFKDNAIEVGYFPQCSIQDLLNSLIIVNKAINLSLNKFSKLYEPGSFEAHNLLHLLLIEIKKELEKIKKELEKDVNFCKLLSIGSNDPLEEFLIRSLDLEITNSKLEDTKIINEIFLRFENAIALYKTFLKEAKLIYGYQEFSETIRKIFATVAGSILACALLWGKKSTLAEKLESSLKVGI
jgi:GT2 family glycosyltransferase